MSLIHAASRRKAGLYLLIAILAAAGIYQVTRLPAAIFPSVTFPIIRVIADAGEEPAARMMPAVTHPLEEAILRVPGIRDVRSITSRGSSEISADFAWGTDMQVALSRAQAEAARIRPDLPPDTRLDVEWMNPASFPIQGYALISDRMTLAELRTLAEYTIRPALIRIPGVSQVQIQGGRQREFEVRLNHQALEARGLGVSDVVDAITREDAVLSAGLTERNHELYLTLVNGRAHSISALDSLAVPTPSGPPAPLRDLGTVAVADEVSYIKTTANGHEAVLINIIRQPSANSISIARAIDRLLSGQHDLIPRGVQWITFYDQARFVSNSVGGTRDAILIGIALAALVLFIFLRNWKLTAIAVAVIPITVAVVGLALGILHQTTNLMTLAGVAAALGLIADDAIVVIEDIERRARYRGNNDRGIARVRRSAGTSAGSGEDPAADPGDRPRNGRDDNPAESVRGGFPVAEDREHPAETTLRVIRPALIGSSLSTIVILLPFALLPGVSGAFFKPLALTMGITLVISFFFALVAVPVSVHAFVPAVPAPRPRAPRSWWRRFSRVWWHRLAESARRSGEVTTRVFVTRGILPLAVVAALIVVAWLLYRAIGTDFLPAMDEGSIILDYFTPPGTSLADTNQMLSEVERVILSTPDVAGYSRRTGTQLGFFITEPNTGDYVIKLKPRGQRRGVDEVIDDIRSRVAQVEPAVSTDFGQLLEDNVGDLTGGSPQPIDVKVFGDDPALLKQKAREIARMLGEVPGVEDVFDGITIAGPALDIHVDPEAAARFGLTAQEIHQAVEPAVTGKVVDQVRVGERMYDLRVFADPPGSLADLKIRSLSPSAALVPLGSVARITTGPPEAEIDRENLKSYFGVTARLSGRDLGGAMRDIRRALSEKVRLGPGMSLRYGGLYQQQQQSFRGLLYVLLSGLVLVSVITLFEFADWRAPVAVLICAVAVLAGVLGALILAGQTLNISSYVGAIMMVGIVGENSIFVIHEAKLALEAGAAPSEAWMTAARLRLRPVAMTVLATAFALAPLALAIGQGAQLMQPLAIAVIGGFVLSGPIVLLVLPGIYRLLDPKGRLGDGPERLSSRGRHGTIG